MAKIAVTVLFWLQWMLVTSLCFALLFPLWKSVGPFAFIIYWFLLGFSQALVLLQKAPYLFISWFLTTSFVGIGLLGLLVLFAFVFFSIILSTEDIGLAPSLGMIGAAWVTLMHTFLGLPFLALIGGILISWAQGRVLRFKIPLIIGWISVNAISWMLASGLLMYVCVLFRIQLLNSSLVVTDADFKKIIIGLASTGAIGGVIKGGILAWSLHQSRS